MFIIQGLQNTNPRFSLPRSTGPKKKEQ